MRIKNMREILWKVFRGNVSQYKRMSDTILKKKIVRQRKRWWNKFKKNDDKKEYQRESTRLWKILQRGLSQLHISPAFFCETKASKDRTDSEWAFLCMHKYVYLLYAEEGNGRMSVVAIRKISCTISFNSRIVLPFLYSHLLFIHKCSS